MSLHKWQKVILDWVNCLKISDPIQQITQLLEGDFFFKLKGLLLFEEPDTSETPFEYILTFTKKHYPLYQVAVEDDCTEITLMCTELSIESQIRIKQFLEKISSFQQIKRVHVLEAIDATDSSGNSNSTPKSSKNMDCKHVDSPLETFFKTPLRGSKQKSVFSCEHHTQEIHKLRALLETEKYEKFDLQDELSSCKDNIRKLEKCIEIKNSEIYRLKAELFTIENEAVTCSQNVEKSGELKRLQAEIQSLQQYISTLENEQVELRKERDEAKSKFNSLSKESKCWQRRAHVAEQSYESLLEESSYQTQQLSELRTRCKELDLLIEDLKEKKSPDLSGLVSPQKWERWEEKSPELQSLASTVVEIQLNELKSENTELIRNANCLQSQNDNLSKQIQSLERRLDLAMAKNVSLTENNSELLEKAATLAETQTLLRDTKSELDKALHSISSMVEEKTSRTRDFKKLENELLSKNKYLDQMETENSKLITETKKLQKELNSIRENYDQEKVVTSELENKLRSSKTTIEDYESKFKKFELENNALVMKMQQMEINLSSLIQRMSSLAPEANVTDTDDKILQIQEILNALELTSFAFSNERNILEQKCSNFENEITKLLEELKGLNEKNIEGKKVNYQLEIMLHEANRKVCNLEIMISKLNEEIEKLTKLSTEHTAALEEIEQMKSTLTKKDELLDSTETQIMNLLKRVEDANNNNVVIENNLALLKETYCKLESESQCKIEHYEKLIKEYENTVKSLSLEKEDLASRLKEAESENRTVGESYEQFKALSDDTIQDLREHVASLSKQLETLLVEKTELSETISHNSNQLQETQETLKWLEESSKRSIDALQDNLKEQEYLILKKDEDIINLNTSINELQQSLTALKMNESFCKEFIEDLSSQVEALTLEAKCYESKIVSLKMEEEDIDKEVENILEEIALVGKLKSQQDGPSTAVDFKSKISQTGDKILKLMSSELKIALLTSFKKDFEIKNAVAASTKKLEELQVQIDKLINDKNDALNTINALEIEKVNLLEKLEGTEKLLAENVQSLSELEKVHTEYTSENTETIANLMENIKSLENTITALKQECENYKAQLKSSEAEINLLKNVNIDLESMVADERERRKETERINDEKIGLLTMLQNGLKEELLRKTADYEEYKVMVKEVHAEKLASLESDCKKMEEEFERKCMESSALIEKLQNENGSLQNKLANVSREKEKLEEHHKETIRNLENALLHHQEEINKAQVEITALKNSNLQLADDKKYVNKKMRQLEQDLCEAREVQEQLDEITLKKMLTTQDKLILMNNLIEHNMCDHDRRLEALNVSIEAKGAKIEYLGKFLLKERENFNRRMQFLQENNEMLRQCVDDNELRVVHLENELAQASENVSKLKCDLEQKVMELNCSNEKLSEYENEIRKIEFSLREVEEKYKFEIAANASNLQEADNFDDEGQKSGPYLNKLAVVNTKLSYILAKLIETEDEKSELFKAVKLCEEEIANLTMQRDELLESQAKIISETEENISKAHQHAICVKQDLMQQVQAANDSLENERQAKEKIEIQIEECKQRMDDLNFLCNKLQSEKSKAELLKETLIRIFNQLNERLGNTFQCVSELEDGNFFETMASNIVKLKETFMENLLLEEEMQIDLHGKDEELSKLTQVAQDAKEDKQKLEDEIKYLHQKLENASSEYEELKNEMRVTQKNIENELDRLREENFAFKIALKDAEHELVEATKAVDKINLERNELNKKLDEVLEKNADYEVQLANCEAKLNECSKDSVELKKIKEAYTNLMSEYTQLQLEISILKRTIDERNAKLSEASVIKEAYEKLLEENHRVQSELDSVIFKRARDKEDFKNIIEKERKDLKLNMEGKLQEIRRTYEDKLQKLREKMVALVQEEVEKERLKLQKKSNNEHSAHAENIQKLKSELWRTGEKYLETKNELLRAREQISAMKTGTELFASRDSLLSLPERKLSTHSEPFNLRTSSTLPRSQKDTSKVVDEVAGTFSRTRLVSKPISQISGQELVMEDEEGELFNNTYLSDLRTGRCVPSSSDSQRLTELMHRNSMCPPHLKSSYPAETQFASPSKFKEDDIKNTNPETSAVVCAFTVAQGNLDVEEDVDSKSSYLVVNDKSSKTRGKTIYKKPGPPTPSKNGGRLSLQGNDLPPPKEVLREQNDSVKTPRSKLSTPNRIKALLLGNKRNSENIPATPKGGKLSLFRKHKN